MLAVIGASAAVVTVANDHLRDEVLVGYNALTVAFDDFAELRAALYSVLSGENRPR